jgi:hypothetical protein
MRTSVSLDAVDNRMGVGPMTTPNDKIDVDLEQLRTSGKGISDDTNAMLAPGISDANGRIFRGLHIGDRTQSGEVEATRRALAYAMDRFLRNGVAQVERARNIVAFLDKVLTEYKTADDFAKLDVDKVLAGLDEVARRQPAPTSTQSPKGFFE